MTEQQDLDTQIEAAKQQEAAAAEERRRLRALKEQRETLLPQLERAKQKLSQEIRARRERHEEITVAIADINNGQLTDFRLRAPRKPRAKKAEEGE